MNSEQKTNFALFASAKLNDKKVFEQYKDSIDNIIKNFDKEKLINPYSDTRLLVDNDKKEIKNNPFFCPDKDLVKKLESYIDDLREELSRNAVEWAKQFSWDKSAEKFEKLIISLV